ncbi:phosphoenolpyruvate carboxykinase (GTP) [Mumia zhuanghuii]|uniref:Phosphoenolpyruvate carboxykinase [GTP] n=1 Tax=Mumia zhuanghuii TaxID=2585211 RepID=A0A5C4MU70_9ACTN|nr:phosphoenolpyruvate carboxykinase (GTP) [Mumia zhuanghuii]TNC44682.1 phosphoenolpyruvate carboxykinase (GTP) [Mumia zhuanghuii]TNC48237.1 phosphoenolpyruvate carboxykinase (GTP) [Mumia zhuanghuii]
MAADITTDDPITSTYRSSHGQLQAWVDEVAALTKPDSITWIEGTPDEWTRLTDELVEAGTFVRLDETKKPNSFWCASDPTDVARVEDRTFICSVDESDAGPTNNWMAPADMKRLMTDLYDGSMRGRTMFVIPFVMGHIDSEHPMFGVEITDSAYVVASMTVMARVGRQVLDKIEATNAAYVPALHSVGAPLAPGETDVPWPCNDTKYIVQFPEERMIWSYGSGYGGNALLGKKCYSLRIASVMGRDEGWLAEHMLILKLTSPENEVKYIAAAFPSACGKTNLAMVEPTIPGWKVETLGDDIAWMRIGADGRLYAVNPEFGLFGVAPGTGWDTNANAMRTIAQGNSVFTNVALTDDGDVWWEGMTEDAPAHLTDWKGRDWTPESEELSSHPNSRFCTPIRQCPILAPEYDDPNGVPIDAILFGGRRKTTIPLVTEARDWTHGTFMGATLSSETTAAATGAVGVVRRDPMAMLPFIGYDAGDYFSHWISMAKNNDESKFPKVFYVNWFRRDEDGGFLWPGFGENSRVLKYVVERIEGKVDAVETPIGLVPAPGALDTDGLDVSDEQIAKALAVDVDEWKAEIPQINDWFEKFGDKLPAVLWTELDGLKARLEA